MLNAVLATLVLFQATPPKPAQAAPRLVAALQPTLSSAAPGGTLDLLINLDLTPPWHLYHPILLSTGLPTTISLTLPDGVAAGPVRFPAPTLGTAFETEYLGLAGRITLLTTLTVAADVPGGTMLNIAAEVRGLACIEACVPVRAEATLSLPVSVEPGTPLNQDALAAARQAMPPPLAEAPYLQGSRLAVSHEKLAAGQRGEIAAVLRVQPDHHIQDRDPGIRGNIPTRLFIETVDGVTLARDRESWPAARVRDVPGVGRARELSGECVIRIPFEITDTRFPPGPVSLRVLLRYQACRDGGQCFPPAMAEGRVTFEVVADAAETVRSPEPLFQPAAAAGDAGDRQILLQPAAAAGGAAGGGDRSAGAEPSGRQSTPGIAWVLLAAFLGGVILNVMPCVLPVVSLKIFSFVNQAGESPGRVLRLGLMYTAGVLASFLPVAIIMTYAGMAWGGLMQQPAFLILLIAVVFAFGLSMLGVYEIQLPGFAMSVAGDATTREGCGGAFLNGVLATALATPCVGPFLGSAVGLLTRFPPLVMGAGIMAVGLGLAAPYLLLTAFPAWLAYLPRPGKWMVTFKQLVGFILMAVVVWLYSILTELVDRGPLMGSLALLCAIGLACWLLGRLDLNATRAWSALIWSGALASIATGAVGGFWLFRQVPTEIAWQKWEPGIAQRLAADGYTVYVDYTATWCTTCQYNKSFILHSAPVVQKMRALGIVAVKADFTRYDPGIQRELNDHGRNGVPLNLILPAGKPDAPIILPEVLTQATVLEALARAGPSHKTPFVAHKTP
jgi:thiol:disulfide interchange protein